ncbi:MAG: Glu-tRNA(Gln) amidotransferase subunit GatE [Candidatus Bathyarchaeota archaeon]|nr:Glu-tRNA(Gln) amidotransferase subunit GatE [Candidatus Bathyarchaeota archaeon]
MSNDYSKLGLKIGLEIHQQLNTACKLFCECKPLLFKDDPELVFLRRLRPTQSELGQVDPAAFFEFQKGIIMRYESNEVSSCLVEMDEEPPHSLNNEAVETVLTAALMMNAKPVDEIHIMRKTVIDGSNTTGFQRTCVIAMDGWIKIGEKKVPIQHASLEEDAARKTGAEKNGEIIRYRLDRLGIPLIEIATAPVIYSPKEAQDVALVLGRILRDTGKVMRGLGTIRQDLNISLSKGALIEIKGVQELELISLVLEYEIKRQVNLIKISNELKKQNLSEDSFERNFIDVTNVFSKTKCKVIRKAMQKKKRVYAVKLQGFAGFLKRELMPNFRLGLELADRARYWGRVGGIFHTDEIPAYDITKQEILLLRERVKAADQDAVVFVADSYENSEAALDAVVDRSIEVIIGVPAETRKAVMNGTSRYMRPRPGAARMYPETDIPPLLIREEIVKKIKSNLPEPAEKKIERLIKKYRLNKKLANQLVNSEYYLLFKSICKKSQVNPTTVAVFLTETLKALKREGVKVEQVPYDQVMEIFMGLSKGKLTKEAISDVFVWFSKNDSKKLSVVLDSLGLKMYSIDEINSIVDRVIAENKKTFKMYNQKSFGLLMGTVMREVRGKADPALVSKILKKKIAHLMS